MAYLRSRLSKTTEDFRDGYLKVNLTELRLSHDGAPLWRMSGLSRPCCQSGPSCPSRSVKILLASCGDGLEIDVKYYDIRMNYVIYCCSKE